MHQSAFSSFSPFFFEKGRSFGSSHVQNFWDEKIARQAKRASAREALLFIFAGKGSLMNATKK